MSHRQPASPKAPCRVTRTGEHQWFGFRKWPWSKAITKCWICGARP